ncbi:hypothetical protein, partial [uncultured Dubosiella sp.]
DHYFEKKEKLYLEREQQYLIKEKEYQAKEKEYQTKEKEWNKQLEKKNLEIESKDVQLAMAARRVMERQGLAASEAFDLLGYSSQTREIVQRLLYN